MIESNPMGSGVLSEAIDGAQRMSSLQAEERKQTQNSAEKSKAQIAAGGRPTLELTKKESSKIKEKKKLRKSKRDKKKGKKGKDSEQQAPVEAVAKPPEE